MADFSIYDTLDLKDPNFGWRGRYRVIKFIEDSDLVLIENLGTRSRQHAKRSNLRVCQCQQFSVW